MARQGGEPVAVTGGGGDTSDPGEVGDAAVLALIAACVTTTIQAGARSDPPLSPTQVRTLTVIGSVPGGLSLGAVAVAISASNPSASRLCQRLVRDGLLDRDAGPGNELRLSLSHRGQDTLDAVNRARLADLRSVLDALPPGKRRRAVAALGDLAEQIPLR